MPSPHEMAKGMMANRGVLEAAESTSKACHKLSTKTPEVINYKSKAAGPRAGRLTAPNAQGVSLLSTGTKCLEGVGGDHCAGPPALG